MCVCELNKKTATAQSRSSRDGKIFLLPARSKMTPCLTGTGVETTGNRRNHKNPTSGLPLCPSSDFRLSLAVSSGPTLLHIIRCSYWLSYSVWRDQATRSSVRAPVLVRFSSFEGACQRTDSSTYNMYTRTLCCLSLSLSLPIL